MTDSEAVRSARPSKAVKTQPSANQANPELTGEVAALRSIFDSRPWLVTFALRYSIFDSRPSLLGSPSSLF